jgi:hypothetical protein
MEKQTGTMVLQGRRMRSSGRTMYKRTLVDGDARKSSRQVRYDAASKTSRHTVDRLLSTVKLSFPDHTHFGLMCGVVQQQMETTLIGRANQQGPSRPVVLSTFQAPQRSFIPSHPQLQHHQPTSSATTASLIRNEHCSDDLSYKACTMCAQSPSPPSSWW